MSERPGPLDDAKRLAALAATQLDNRADEALDRFARMVRRHLHVPVALVSLVDATRQFFPGASGLPELLDGQRETPLTHSICQTVVRTGDPLVVRDVREVEGLRDNLAVRDLAVVGYAGFPLVDADGLVLGSLCALDSEPHDWNAYEIDSLRDLALACSSELQLQTAMHQTETLYAEQRRSSEIWQRSLLTPPLTSPGLEIAVRYHASVEDAAVGGDWYDAFLQPDGATVVVIGDVTGHDINAAAAMGQLRSLLRGVAYDRGESPALVLERVDAVLAGLRVTAMATCVVARIETDEATGTRTVRWSNAGHPPPMVLQPDGSVHNLTSTPELLLGLSPLVQRTDHVAPLVDGATLLLFTDGLVEHRQLSLDDGLTRLETALRPYADADLDALCDGVITALDAEVAADDVAIVAVRPIG